MALSADTSGRGERRKVRILVVEADTLARSLLLRVLDAEGYEVVGAARASYAVGLCKTGVFDLVVSEVVGIGGSGIEVVRIARKANPEVRALFMSGGPRSSHHFEVDGPRWGFVEKPIDIDIVVNEVSRLLADPRD